MLTASLVDLDNLELRHWKLYNSVVFRGGVGVCLDFILGGNFLNTIQHKHIVAYFSLFC